MTNLGVFLNFIKWLLDMIMLDVNRVATVGFGMEAQKQYAYIFNVTLRYDCVGLEAPKQYV